MRNFKEIKTQLADAASKTLPDDDESRNKPNHDDESILDYIERTSFSNLEKIAMEYYAKKESINGMFKSLSQDQIDMEFIKDIHKFVNDYMRGKSKLERYNELMNHFLSGSYNNLSFNISDLLTTNKGARIQVSDCINMRLIRHSDSLLMHPSCDTDSSFTDFNVKHPRKYGAYSFKIPQEAYKDLDWHFSLGTYTVFWEPIVKKTKHHNSATPLCSHNLGKSFIDQGTLALTKHKSPSELLLQTYDTVKYAKVWGAKIWRWHKDTWRDDKLLHQAAYRLVQSGKLNNFWVIANPCIIDVKTGLPARI